MDFVNKAISSVTPSSEAPKVVDPPKDTTTPAGPGIIASAKDTAGVGAGKVAGATANLIGAGKEYAGLDVSQGVGKQVDQAETYVRSFDGTKKEEGGVAGAVKAAEGLFKK